MFTPDFSTLNNDQFIECDGRLQYIATERTTVIVASVVGTPWYLLCQITFSRKHGSIFVQFPYFKDSKGVVSEIVFEDLSSTKMQEISFIDRGRVTSHHVKYSHPPDGLAHFSQDKKVISAIRRQSFSLLDSDGILFELHAYCIDKGFEAMSPVQVRKSRAYLPWVFRNPMPQAITLSGEWKTKRDLEKEIQGDLVGPRALVPRRSDGALYKAFLLGQPAGFPLRDHLLLINLGAANEIEVPKPLMLFLGGWDDRKKGSPRGTGCLSFMYPISDYEEAAQMIGTIDYNPKPAVVDTISSPNKGIEPTR